MSATSEDTLESHSTTWVLVTLDPITSLLFLSHNHGDAVYNALQWLRESANMDDEDILAFLVKHNATVPDSKF